MVIKSFKLDFINLNKSFTLNKKIIYKLKLLKGTYEFNLIYNRNNLTDIDSKKNLIKIHEISVKNTKYGGGYKCSPCENVLNYNIFLLFLKNIFFI